MTNSKVLFHHIKARLSAELPLEERRQIAYRIAEAMAGISRTDIASEKTIYHVGWKALENAIDRVNLNEPLQYILGEQEFYGRRFGVNPAVLIPRPETEYLIDTVVAYLKRLSHSGKKIMDLGVGSGCLAITLALEIDGTQLYGIDNSSAALETARQNARHHGAHIALCQCDMLDERLPTDGLDVIVSNPPYIAHSEKDDLPPRIYQHEPHGALFVPDHDPLLYYRAIAAHGRRSLRKGGLVAVEAHAQRGKEVAALYRKEGYRHVSLLRDYAGRERVVHAVWERD